MNFRLFWRCNLVSANLKLTKGYASENVRVEQPRKKSKGSELDIGEKFMNALLSSLRIVVEHSISGIKDVE